MGTVARESGALVDCYECSHHPAPCIVLVLGPRAHWAVPIAELEPRRLLVSCDDDREVLPELAAIALVARRLNQ